MKVGKSLILNNTSARTTEFFNVSDGGFNTRAGEAGTKFSPAENGIIRFNDEFQYLEGYLRNKWAYFLTENDLKIPGVKVEEDENVTLKYLSTVLAQIKKTAVFTLDYKNDGHSTYNAGIPNYIKVNSGSLVGTSKIFGERYICVNGNSSNIDIDIFKACFPNETDETQRWNYKYNGFGVCYKVDTSATCCYGRNYGYISRLTPLWTKEPSANPTVGVDDPNYGKFNLKSYFYGAGGTREFGVRIYITLFKFQNFKLKEVDNYQVPVINPLPSKLTIDITSHTFNFNLFSYLVNNYPLWDLVTPVNIDLNIGTGIYIGSKNKDTAAFTIENIPNGSIINIVNKGTILGYGGKGGEGAKRKIPDSILNLNYPNETTVSVPFALTDETNGEDGGLALDIKSSTNTFINFDNRYGKIIGGAGGGAGGHAIVNYNLIDSYFTSLTSKFKVYNEINSAKSFLQLDGNGKITSSTISKLSLEAEKLNLIIYRNDRTNKISIVMLFKSDNGNSKKLEMNFSNLISDTSKIIPINFGTSTEVTYSTTYQNGTFQYFYKFDYNPDGTIDPNSFTPEANSNSPMSLIQNRYEDFRTANNIAATYEDMLACYTNPVVTDFYNTVLIEVTLTDFYGTTKKYSTYATQYKFTYPVVTSTSVSFTDVLNYSSNNKNLTIQSKIGNQYKGFIISEIDLDNLDGIQYQITKKDLLTNIKTFSFDENAIEKPIINSYTSTLNLNSYELWGGSGGSTGVSFPLISGGNGGKTSLILKDSYPGKVKPSSFDGVSGLAPRFATDLIVLGDRAVNPLAPILTTGYAGGDYNFSGEDSPFGFYGGLSGAAISGYNKIVWINIGSVIGSTS